ncbi:MAG: acetolactate decarboxylase [Solirubrobacteraceae bacterium]|nr:acetolactate decarboxylase [Solirubrobacteraceae bacterium]
MDDRLLHALHVRALHRAELAPERAPHVVFQTSTIAALLDGAYDGDVTIGEVLEHGDHGLGTLDALDGELVVVDGAAYRATVAGRLEPVDPAERTPFAVVIPFAADVRVELDGPRRLDELLAEADRHLPGGPALAHAIRVDGRFARIRARSVPRQARPYRPLAEVVAQQRVFELHDLDATLVGFRFPDAAGALNVTGHHLHVADAARARGGHVFDLVLLEGTLRIDHSSEVHAELPPGVGIATTAAAARAAAAAVERER